jgi:hypothetical protein
MPEIGFIPVAGENGFVYRIALAVRFDGYNCSFLCERRYRQKTRRQNQNAGLNCFYGSILSVKGQE